MKKKSVLKSVTAMTMALGICLSVPLISFAEVTSIDKYAVDKQSGLAPYRDDTLGLYGYVNTFNNNEVVIPAQYYDANAFFNGYAIVRVTERSSDEHAKNIFAFINGAGNEVFRDEYVFYNKNGDPTNVNPSFYIHINDPYGYAYYSILQSDIGLIYRGLKYDGTMVQRILDEFPPITNSDGLQGYARLGDFVNGSANVYAPIEDNSVTGDFGQVLNKYRVVGSLTSDGVFSTEINPESKFEKSYTNQAGSTASDSAYEKLNAAKAKTTEGWVQDATGWWYRNADGSYPMNTWKEINGKQYYFGGDGYMLVNYPTPDGFYVGSDGAWVTYSLSDENVQQIINEFVELYEGAFYIDQTEFEENVRTFFTEPAEAQYVIDLIRNNHTFVPDEF